MGIVSWDEFEEATENSEEVKSWLSTLELSHHDMKQMFRLLDADGNGELSLDEVVVGAPRLKGHATSVDVASIMIQLNRIENVLQGEEQEGMASQLNGALNGPRGC